MSTLIEVIRRLKNYVTEFGHQYPQVWQQVDAIRGGRGRSWEDWCFLPFDELPSPHDTGHISTPQELLSAANTEALARDFEFHYKLSALGAEGLAAALIDAQHDIHQFLYDVGFHNHLPTIDAESIRGEIRDLLPLVSLVTYICVEAAAVGNGSGNHPARPRPTRTRRGERLFPPDSPTEWQVAYRLGAALRRAYAAEDAPLGATGTGHASPRPHIRRGHWHSFWTGRRSVPSERNLTAKWLPPIAVNVSDVEQLVPTIRTVD